MNAVLPAEGPFSLVFHTAPLPHTRMGTFGAFSSVNSSGLLPPSRVLLLATIVLHLIMKQTRPSTILTQIFCHFTCVTENQVFIQANTRQRLCCEAVAAARSPLIGRFFILKLPVSFKYNMLVKYHFIT